jgi:CARDB
MKPFFLKLRDYSLLIILSLFLILNAHAATTINLCAGDSANIEYSAINVSSCSSITSGYGVYPVNQSNFTGSFSVTAQNVGTVFTFTCFDFNSTQVVRNVTLNVIPCPGSDPTVVLSASPIGGVYPTPVNMSINYTNSLSCEVKLSDGTIILNRNAPLVGGANYVYNVKPIGPTTITATCWAGLNGTGASITDTKVVNMSCPANKLWSNSASNCIWSLAPQGTLILSKVTAEELETFNVDFSSNYSDSCVLSKDGTTISTGQLSGNFADTISIAGAHNYQLVCNSLTTSGNQSAMVTKNITITAKSYPDLIISANPSPLTAFTNTPTTINAKIRNSGAATTGGSMSNAISIASAPNDASIIANLSTGIVATLAVNAEANISTSYTYTTAGTYYIKACTDTLSNINEGPTGEANNCSAWSNVVVSPAPSGIDLIATDVGVPPSTYAEDPVIFTFDFRNNGTNATPASFPTLLKYSTNSNGIPTTLAMVELYNNSLGAGVSDNTLITYTFNTPGIYYYSTCVDQDITGASTINEDSNENNNCTAWGGPLIVNPKPTVNLKGNAITLPSNMRAGNSYPVSFNISNDGSSAATNFPNMITYSSQTDYSNPSRVMVTYPGSLAAGNSTNIGFNVTFPTGGTYYYNACADTDLGGSTIPEISEDDNCSSIVWQQVSILDQYDPISISIKSNVVSQISKDILVPTTASISWTSNVNTCEFIDKQSNVIGSWLGVGSSPNYSYSFTLTSGAPQNRTELTTTHLGSNALGYDIKCKDSLVATRGSLTRGMSVETYVKTVPSFQLLNGGDLIAKCTPDFDYVLIKRDNVTIPGYPRIFSNNQTVPFSTQFTPVANSTYSLTCKSQYSSANTSIAVYPGGVGTNLSMSAALSAGSNFDSKTALIDNDSLSVISTDGAFDNLYVNVSNFDSWDLKFYNAYYANPPAIAPTYSGTSASPSSLPSELRLIAGTINNVSTIASTDTYLNGFTIKLTATKGAESKTFWIKLNTSITPTAYLDYTPKPEINKPNLIDMTLRCKNATNWELHHVNIGGGNATLIDSGAGDLAGIYTKNITAPGYDTGLQTGGTHANIKLICINGSNTGNAEKNIPIPDRAPAEIKSLNVLPAEVTCPGGSNEVNLNWTIGNTYSKACHIIATPITDSVKSSEQISYINNNMLNSETYNSVSGNGIGSIMSTIDKRDNNGDSKAKIQLKYTQNGGKLPVSGTRLFLYSTRFTLECDARDPNPSTQTWSSARATYSSKSVDVQAKCTTQN